MKIREGFVSNSSTSSFIIIGNKITKEDAIKEFLIYYPNYDTTSDEFDDEFMDWCYEQHGDVVYLNEIGYFKGTQLMDSGGYDISEMEVSLKSLIEKFGDKVKMYTGIYPC